MATMDAKPIFVDTNVLVYANNKDSAQCEVAREKLDALIRSGNTLLSAARLFGNTLSL